MEEISSLDSKVQHIGTEIEAHIPKSIYIYTHIVCMYTYTLSICIYTLNICIFFVRLRTPGFDGRRGSGKRSGRRWSSSGKRQKF